MDFSVLSLLFYTDSTPLFEREILELWIVSRGVSWLEATKVQGLVKWDSPLPSRQIYTCRIAVHLVY